MKGNFISSKDSGLSQPMHAMSANGNIKIIINNNTNAIISELFSSLVIIYQIDLETSMKSGHFLFDQIDGMYYKCHRISLNRRG